MATRDRTKLLFGLASALMTGALAGPVQATSITGPTILPDALGYEYLGGTYVSGANGRYYNSGIGTYTVTGPGCGGVCSATTSLGADPSVSLTYDEVEYALTGGGVAGAYLAYFVEYVNAPGTYDVNFHAVENIMTDAYLGADVDVQFGMAGNSPQDFNDFTSYELKEGDCVNTCPQNFIGVTPAPIPADQTIQMVANTLYEVELGVDLTLGTTGDQVTTGIDPTFSAPGSGGTFLFSPGVIDSVAAVPEPTNWVMMISGFGAIGAAVRRTLSKKAFAL